MNDIKVDLPSPGEESEEFHIHDHERLLLIDVLSFMAAMLKSRAVWFNDKNDEAMQDRYADFCREMAEKFANMQVIESH